MAVLLGAVKGKREVYMLVRNAGKSNQYYELIRRDTNLPITDEKFDTTSEAKNWARLRDIKIS